MYQTSPTLAHIVQQDTLLWKEEMKGRGIERVWQGLSSSAVVHDSKSCATPPSKVSTSGSLWLPKLKMI